MFTPEMMFMSPPSGPSWREAITTVSQERWVSHSYSAGIVVNSAENRTIGAEASTLYQGSMSTPGDTSTWSYDSSSFSMGAHGVGSVYDLASNPDLSKIWVVTQDSKIVQYNLSTPGVLSTASHYSTKDFGDTWDPVYEYYVPTVRGMWMAPDESWCLIGGPQHEGCRVDKYELTTPGNISTLSLLHGISVTGAAGAGPRGIVCSPNGDVFWYMIYSGGYTRGYQYSLSTPFDFTTATYDSIKTFFSSTSTDWHVTEDGNRIYILDSNYSRLYTYA
jgi:hypothetical protein